MRYSLEIYSGKVILKSSRSNISLLMKKMLSINYSSDPLIHTLKYIPTCSWVWCSPSSCVISCLCFSCTASRVLRKFSSRCLRCSISSTWWEFCVRSFSRRSFRCSLRTSSSAVLLGFSFRAKQNYNMATEAKLNVPVNITSVMMTCF